MLAAIGTLLSFILGFTILFGVPATYIYCAVILIRRLKIEVR
jgi:hypothetical protein